MVKFESPIGDRKFAGKQMKEVEIPDESEYQDQEIRKSPVRRRGAQVIDDSESKSFQSRLQEIEEDPAEVERNIQLSRDIRTGKDRLSEGARRRIEILMGMTRTKRTFEIDGNQFMLQSLKSKEMNDAIRLASAFDGTTSSPFEIRKHLLAYSLVKVAGLDIDQFVGSNSFESKLALIDELDNALLNRIYDEYMILDKEAREKYSLKTPAEVKEVVEDLKK